MCTFVSFWEVIIWYYNVFASADGTSCSCSLQSLNFSHQSIPLDFGFPNCPPGLFSSVTGSGLPEQQLLLILESRDVLLVLIQGLQVSCLLNDLAIFIFFDLIAILVDLDFFDVDFYRLLSPS